MNDDLVLVSLSRTACMLLAELLMSKQWVHASDVFGADLIDRQFNPSAVYSCLKEAAGIRFVTDGHGDALDAEDLRTVWATVENSIPVPSGDANTTDQLFGALYELAYEHGYQDGTDDR